MLSEDTRIKVEKNLELLSSFIDKSNKNHEIVGLLSSIFCNMLTEVSVAGDILMTASPEGIEPKQIANIILSNMQKQSDMLKETFNI